MRLWRSSLFCFIYGQSFPQIRRGPEWLWGVNDVGIYVIK